MGKGGRSERGKELNLDGIGSSVLHALSECF